MRFYKDPKKIYLDSAKEGPLYYELLNWRNNYEKKSLISKSLLRLNHKNFVDNVAKSVSDFFKVKNGDVFFTNSFSRGFHSLITNLKGKPLFLLLEDDYPSISESLNSLGFDIIYIKNDSSIEKNIENGIKKYNPDFLVISIVQWIDGLKIDIDFLKVLKLNFKNLTIIGDGTQFCGTSKFNFNESPFDVIISSGYKWMLSGYGIAFMLVKKHFYNNKFIKSSQVEFKRSIDIGHYNMLAIGSLFFSVNKLKLKIEKIEKKLTDLSINLKKELNAIGMLNSKILNRKHHSTIFNIKDKDGSLFEYLTKNNFICSQRGEGTRISLNFFNNKAEINKLILALKNFNYQH